MSDKTETAILAGGCFWGVQELLRHRDGVISTRVGYTGGENDHPTYRNHPGHAEAVEIVFDPERSPTGTSSSSSSRSTTRRPRTARATTSAPATARRSSTRATSSARSPRTRSPTSTRQASGPARWSPRSARPSPSGRPSPSTRTTSSATRTATRATSRGRAGSCRTARPPSDKSFGARLYIVSARSRRSPATRPRGCVSVHADHDSDVAAVRAAQDEAGRVVGEVLADGRRSPQDWHVRKTAVRPRRRSRRAGRRSPLPSRRRPWSASCRAEALGLDLARVVAGRDQQVAAGSTKAVGPHT